MAINTLINVQLYCFLCCNAFNFIELKARTFIQEEKSLSLQKMGVQEVITIGKEVRHQAMSRGQTGNEDNIYFRTCNLENNNTLPMVHKLNLPPTLFNVFNLL